MKTWEITIPYYKDGNTFFEFNITYYVKGNTAKEAEDKAESWLPPHYEVAGPFKTIPFEPNIANKEEDEFSSSPVAAFRFNNYGLRRSPYGFTKSNFNPSKITNGKDKIDLKTFRKMFGD